MKIKQIFWLIVLALASISAVKTQYGGEIVVRLNQPASFTHSSSSYSNLVFFSLLYENFFYMEADGHVFSHIFTRSTYHKETKQLELVLGDRLSFSDGRPVTVKEVNLSLNIFLNQNLANAKRLRQLIRDIRSETGKVFINLLYDRPDILNLLTVPELVLLPGDKMTFSGMFYPDHWVKDEYLLLKPNPFYPGGRTYVDGVRVVFRDNPRSMPDVFLSNPDRFREHGVIEHPSGIYQNVYICFPKGRLGKNTRAALYTLLKQFYQTRGGQPLGSLTSDEESPVTINIRRTSNRRMRSILRNSRINLYILSSLKEIETPFQEFLAKKGLRLPTIFIGENQLVEYLSNTPIEFLLVEKVFRQAMSLDEKVKKILQEMSFARFDEKHLKMLSELDEVKYLKNDELLLDQIARVVGQIIQDGFLLPISQNRYSLYVNSGLKGVVMDYYGRPLFQKVRFEK